MKSSGGITKEMLFFFAAVLFIVLEAARLTAAHAAIVAPEKLRVSDSVPSLAVADIGRKEDIQAFLAGRRENPFADPAGAHGSDVHLTGVTPRTDPKTGIKPPPPRRTPPTPPVTVPKPPPPPPTPPTPPDTTPKMPKPYELPVSLAGVITVDGLRRVVLQVKDNRYYLTMQPGERLDSLEIEVVSVEGEEVTLKSTKTGESFLLRDLIDKLNREQETPDNAD
ncbi:MAG: hypothetical protein JW909_12410 [Planctomycetes bacterium]|nr:hypothetical protein [Planctomycetota bacterium]